MAFVILFILIVLVSFPLAGLFGVLISRTYIIFKDNFSSSSLYDMYDIVPDIAEEKFYSVRREKFLNKTVTKYCSNPIQIEAYYQENNEYPLGVKPKARHRGGDQGFKDESEEEPLTTGIIIGVIWVLFVLFFVFAM